MNLLELLKRATPSPEPVFSGEWATLTFRPDLGSQQEFILGVAAAIVGDQDPHILWLPSLSKLGFLYGDAFSTTDASELLRGAELAIRSSFRYSLEKLDCGTPHVRAIPCGYMATHDVDEELRLLLKKQAGAMWSERDRRESPMDDDWAYSTMLQTVTSAQVIKRVFVAGRTVVIDGKTLRIGLDNHSSYGNIVSARYSQFSTVERHVFSSLRQITVGHKMANRSALPALFVVLPGAETTLEALVSKKSAELLFEVADMGILQFCDSEPIELAKKIEAWANA